MNLQLTHNKPLKALLVLMILFWTSCKPGGAPADKEDDAAVEPAGTPVTITHATVGTLSETVEVNAVSSFLLKTFVKASANGYLQVVNAQVGKYVSKGQELFVLKTKESQNLGNTINALDTT